jgi:hypothetical protein
MSTEQNHTDDLHLAAPAAHPLAAALSALASAADATRDAINAVLGEDPRADGAARLAAANQALLAVMASVGVKIPIGRPLGRPASDVADQFVSKLRDLADRLIQLPVVLAGRVKALQAAGHCDGVRPILQLNGFHGGLFWWDRRGPDYPCWPSPDNVAVGIIGRLPDGHPARAICTADEWVVWEGQPCLVYGPGSVPFVELDDVRSTTAWWRRYFNLKQQQAEEQRRREEAEAERRRDPLARIEDLERRLAGR